VCAQTVRTCGLQMLCKRPGVAEVTHLSYDMIRTLPCCLLYDSVAFIACRSRVVRVVSCAVG
jgi:hypothetical protein